MPQGPTIFVLVPMQNGYARKIACGVRAYAVAHEKWWVRCGNLPGIPTLRKLNPGPGGGIIGFFGDPEAEAIVLDEHRVPAVNVSFRNTESRMARVLPDNVEVGRRAAQHLLDRGFRSFAFAGPISLGYAHARYTGFSGILADAGFSCEMAPSEVDGRHAWLTGLPKPVGILGADDHQAQRIADFCHELNISVPEQVATVGVDNDADACESTYPPLTSIDTRGFDVGYGAAKLLAEQLAGNPAPHEPVLVPCGEVIVRQSTDTVAVADPDLAFAMRFIREHACDPLRIDDLMEHLTLGRRTLEKRFKAAFGRTLHDEIRRVQLERARELLTVSDMRVPEVAHRVGFSDDRMFTKVFGQAFGSPPGRFRQLNRKR